jgi:ATP-binding cassette, subfamily B (MDR/TAP), member 8
MSFLVATQNTQKSLASVGVLFGQTLKAIEAGARVFEYIDENCGDTSNKMSYPAISFGNDSTKRELQLDTNIKTLDHIEGHIEFKNVYFSYPTRPDQPILENFSLSIPVGSVVAFVGSSGSGKSTIGQV